MTTADDVRQQLDYVYALAYGRARITAELRLPVPHWALMTLLCS